MTKLHRVLIVVLLICPTAEAAPASHSQIVAHRGLLRHAPENTLPNFRACLELRFGFEFDVGRTKDGHLVCIHDRTVDRTTDGTGKVSAFTLSEIRDLDAGSWFAPKFAGLKVPTIKEVLKLIAEHRQHHLLFRADLKAEDAAHEVVRLAEKHGVLNQLLFIGQTTDEVRQIRKVSPKAHVAAVANNPDAFRDAVSNPYADWVKVRYLPSKEQVEAARNSGRRLFIAGPPVDGHVPENWQQAADLGIDAILTDFPLELRRRLREATEKN